jgi:hypothetical protein
MRIFPQRIGAGLISLIWRLLSRYGQIKYRYLLPVYRVFGLVPNRKRTSTRDTANTPRVAQAIVRVLDGASRAVYRDQLKILAGRAEKSKGAVIFLPSVGWKIPSAQRPHLLAREFSRQGYVSIFDCSNAYDDVNGFKEIEPNLFLFRGPADMLSEIKDPILWALTYNFDRKKDYPSSVCTVYDLIDDFDVFVYDRAFLERNHAWALRDATVVTSVARRLHEEIVATRPDALYLPNGVEDWRFADNSSLLPDDPDIAALCREGKPIAGYYGSMAEWFDYDLLEAVSCLRPDWNFLLIGPTFDLSLRECGRRMLKRPNVRWIGFREYASLPGYLRLFDAAMIPFVINNVTLSTSPLKLYEYFAGGKPVITTQLPECQAFSEVHIVRDAEEFSEALDVARREGEDEGFREHLRTLGSENSWSVRVNLVLKHLPNKTEPTGYNSLCRSL